MEKNFNSTSEDAVTTTTDMPAPANVTAILQQSWMQGHSAQRKGTPSLTANQRTSISAMISYISHRSGQSEFRIERSLSDRFNVPNAKCLPSDDFDNAIRYLAEIIIGGVSAS